MLDDHLDITADEFAAGTGWAIKPEGACKADVGVPLGGSGFDLQSTVDRLGLAVVADEDAGLWAVGPESLGRRALVSAEAPELVLPDLERREPTATEQLDLQAPGLVPCGSGTGPTSEFPASGFWPAP